MSIYNRADTGIRIAAMGMSLLASAGAEANTSLSVMPHPAVGAVTSPVRVPSPTREAAARPSSPTPLERVSAAAVDGEGRNLSVFLPLRVILYGLAKADEIEAHTLLQPAGLGAAKLALVLDHPVANPRTAGSYVGVLQMTLNYN